MSRTALLLILVLARARGSAGELVRDGQALGAIQLSSTPDPLDCLVARDVQRYLWRATGVDVPIVEADVELTVPTVVIGRRPGNQVWQRRLEDAFPLSLARNRDAFVLAGDGRHLHIIGASPTATFWAACSWLESLGIRWLFPHPLYGDYVPALNTVPLPVGELLSAPRLDLRSSLQTAAGPSLLDPVYGVDPRTLFGMRHRLNLWVPFGAADGWARLAPGHSYHHYLPPEKYFAEHPDWYEMRDGKRVPHQLCTTSAGAADEVAARIVRDLDGMVERGYSIDRIVAPVSPEDGNAGCECDHCRALNDGPGVASSRVLHFANEVADRVRGVRPGAQIGVYAYANYASVPALERVAPGVLPQLTFWVAGAMAANHARPMLADRNHRFRTSFFAWIAVSEQVRLYTYYGHYAWFTPWPMVTQIAYDLPRLLREPHLVGLEMENHAHGGTQSLNFILATTLMWDPNADPDLILGDFFSHSFGRAAPLIADCFATLQGRMDRLDYVNGQFLGVAELLTPDVVRVCSTRMDAAERLIGTMDAGTAWRVRLVVESLRASFKVGRALRMLAAESGAASGAENRQEIVRLLDRVDAFSRTELGGWAFERTVVARQLGRLRSRIVTDLGRLDRGQTTWSDTFPYGGTLALHGDVAGLRKGPWGYLLDPGQTGRIALPLRALSGMRVRQVRMRLSLAQKTDLELKVTAVAGDRRLELSATNGEFVLPAEILGRRALKIEVDMRSRATTTLLTLVAASLSIDVE